MRSGRLFGFELWEWVESAVRRRLGLVILCTAAVPMLSILTASLQGGYGAQATMVFLPRPPALGRSLPPPAPELKSQAVLRMTAARLARAPRPMSATELDRRFLVVQPEGDDQQAILRATARDAAGARQAVLAWADAFLEQRGRQVRAAATRIRRSQSPARARAAAASAAATAPDARLEAAPEAIGFSGAPGLWTVGAGALMGTLLALILAARNGPPHTLAALRRATGVPVLARFRRSDVDALEARRLAVKLDLLGHVPAQVALAPVGAGDEALESARRALAQAYVEARRTVSVDVVDGAPPRGAVQVLVATPRSGKPPAHLRWPEAVGLVIVDELPR